MKTPSVLAFERKLDTSDALFFAGNWEDRQNGQNWQPVMVREKSVRGTISNRLTGKNADPAKLNASIQNANLQTVDVATLPNNTDTLRVNFTLRILGGVGIPSVCNDQEYQKALAGIVSGYVAEHGFRELAMRYASNIANGRFLWRNRLGAEEIEVQVRHLEKGIEKAAWTFNSLDFSLRNFEVTSANGASLAELAKIIEQALSGGTSCVLDVTAYAHMGYGLEVYPSQELILDASTKKSKTLYTINEIAAMHSQKVGNALRTVDMWYDTDTSVGPIAVEPYGAVTTLGEAFRQPKSNKDFYSLLDNWILKDKKPEAEQQHYVLAVFIRGGVFGESEKSKE